MVSRRTLRVKVMQSLFALEMDNSLELKQLQGSLSNGITGSYKLYTYLLYSLCEIYQYQTTHRKKIKQKHFKTEEDQLLLEHSFHLDFIEFLLEDPVFQKAVKDHKLSNIPENDITKKMFKELIIHKKVLPLLSSSKEFNDKEQRTVLKALLKKLLFKHELFTSHLEYHFINWYDDRSFVLAAVNGMFKTYYKDRENFVVYPDKDERKEKREFAFSLLEKTYRENEKLLALISPQLENWDIDRITRVDTILLKLALCEFMYFPTVPVKVSLNEYIDISKVYSTPKSKDFINGILDKLLKKLKKENIIQKHGRGLVNK